MKISIGLDGELIQRQVFGCFGNRAPQLMRPRIGCLARPRVDQVEGIAIEYRARDRDRLQSFFGGVQAAEIFQRRVVERLHKFGILGSKTIAAHCVHVNDHEMDLLAQTETAVAHNPQSNMNNAVGIADILKMAKKGILVGLGTDAMTVNMMEEVRVALWAQHLKHDNPSCGFMEALSALLFNNAKIANRYWTVPVGALREGWAADIVLIDYFPPTPFDANTVLGHFGFGMTQSFVDTTICGGKVLMENKKLKIDVDEEEAAARSAKLAAKLWQRF